MKKVLGLAIASLICLSILSAGVWAYFSDRETTIGNQLMAGTLDLKTNGVDGVTATFSSVNITRMKPDGTTFSGNVTLRNAGTIDGSTLRIAVSYTESDGSPNSVNMTADQTAAILEVTALTCGSDNLTPGITYNLNNSYLDVQDLKNATITVPGGLSSGSSKVFVMTIKMHDGASNDFQGDGVNIAITFTLNQ